MALWLFGRRNWIERVNNSTPLDSNTVAELGSPASRRALPECEQPIWISVGPENSGVTLGYRKTAEAGVWFGALDLDGGRAETTLGPADDDNAPPGALSLEKAAGAAAAWA